MPLFGSSKKNDNNTSVLDSMNANNTTTGGQGHHVLPTNQAGLNDYPGQAPGAGTGNVNTLGQTQNNGPGRANYDNNFQSGQGQHGHIAGGQPFAQDDPYTAGGIGSGAHQGHGQHGQLAGGQPLAQDGAYTAGGVGSGGVGSGVHHGHGQHGQLAGGQSLAQDGAYTAGGVGSGGVGSGAHQGPGGVGGIPPTGAINHGTTQTGSGGQGSGSRLTGKIESAIGSIVGSDALKAKGLQKEQESNSIKLQGRELAEAERLEREAMMRRERAVGHGADPQNSTLGGGNLSTGTGHGPGIL